MRLVRAFQVGLVTAGILALMLAAWLYDPRLPGEARSLDLDGSGYLTPEQAGPLLRRDFDAIDRDGSGEISGGELRRHVLLEWWRGHTRAVGVADYPERRDEAALRGWLDDAVQAGHLRGVALLLLRDGELVFRHEAGEFDGDSALPLGSAGMWLAATVFTCLDARGELALDAPLAASGMSLQPGWARMTVEQILAHIAGAAPVSGLEFSPETGTGTAATALMARYPAQLPEQEFAYGGVGMQVATAVAEQAAGRSFRRLFIECLGWPMSLDSAAWGHPVTGPRNHGFLSPGHGLHMSLTDYGRFLAMLQRRGRYDGVAVLPPEAIATQELERAGILPRTEMPWWAHADWGYAAGAWCERTDGDGRCTRLVSPGTYGALPWLDRDSGLAGVLLLLDSMARVHDWLLATRALAEQTVITSQR